MITTKRLRIYPASVAQMEAFIAKQRDEVLKAAYQEMLDESLTHPKQFEWYAIWMIELHDGTHVGELCFKELDENGMAEIGYGVLEAYQCKGFATEAVQAVTSWAFKEPRLKVIETEAEEDNIASIRVLEKCGFVPTGAMGKEGLRYILRRI